jgi:tetratricopeptide (TPR) repeat protein
MADRVARHLVAAGQIIDEDPDLAMQHAVAARRIASRIAVVREAVGLAAYAAGDWATAIAELRTYHRMTGKQTHLAEIADCERALGRPERAIDLYRGADRDALDKAGAIELLIVAAGARGDLGQHDAAVAMLQVRELTADEDAEWAARLRYAYADALLAAGRRDEAREWFSRAAAADPEDLTDAAERLLELDGVTLEDDDDEDEDDEATAGDDATAEAGDERDEAQFQGDAFVDEDGPEADLDEDVDADAGTDDTVAIDAAAERARADVAEALLTDVQVQADVAREGDPAALDDPDVDDGDVDDLGVDGDEADPADGKTAGDEFVANAGDREGDDERRPGA